MSLRCSALAAIAGSLRRHWHLAWHWPPGTTWVCYDVVRAGAGMAFVAPSGKIYPVQMQP